jgi:SAM-dependent methyltransferase
MNRNTLVRFFGFLATLIHGDTLVLDRWISLRRRLPRTKGVERLLDVGCGSGAFTIGAARLGYQALGLSWDEENQRIAGERAALCNAPQATFQVMDVRQLSSRGDLIGQFDVVICLECIEHILDDAKLLRDMAACLKPRGRLLLTTPYVLHRPIRPDGFGPFSETETGAHVRRGYSKVVLGRLCEEAGLAVEEVSYCSGWLSQRITWLLCRLELLGHWVAWFAVLPLRWLPLAVARPTDFLFCYPPASICIEAVKLPQASTR